MKASEILQKAHDLLKKPRAWFKGDFAKNAKGERCSSLAPQAVSWCSIGAVWRIDSTWFETQRAEKLLESLVPGGDIAKYNDAKKRTKKEILAFFQKAIRKAKRLEKAAS